MVQSNEAKNNLLQYFSDHGIEQDRIIFCEPAPRELHLKRMVCADLFLDTYPCGAHTTASDSIRAGVPILTIQGKAFSSRVCSSLLYELGAHSLITKNLADYESRAIQLANDPFLYREIKENFIERVNCSNLFSPQIYVKHIELLYEKLLFAKKLGASD
jgi:predicted O-linked N-acetylglucosamine transferase (SPINDLY family)